MVGDGDDQTPPAYVFGVTVSVRPETPGVWADPDAFETTVYRSADPPGEEGWLFFRDNLWRGELNNSQTFRGVVEESLGATVDAVEFRELQASEAYLGRLEAAVAADLDAFNADSPTEALSKYLGSSIRVTDGGE